LRSGVEKLRNEISHGNITGALIVVFEYFAVTAIFLLLMSLPIYGLLRLGIYIGAQRAVDNLIFGFMSAGRDHSELQETTKALKSAIADRNCWYGLFGVSKADWHKNKITADIGDRLEFLAFEGGRLFQRRMEENVRHSSQSLIETTLR
jgi:hypothetical protein